MMPNDDFVSRQWLIDEYHRRHEGPPGGALKMIEEAPAADVEPKQKPGIWLEGYSRQKCSKCGYRGYRSFKFCPNCGNPKIPEPPKEENHGSV